MAFPSGAERSRKLALTKLRATAGTAQTVLLPLLHAAVTGQHSAVTERFGQLGVEGLERPCDAQPAGSRLTGRPATIDGNAHIHVGLLADVL